MPEHTVEHARGLGMILGNLQSLEFVLRVFLREDEERARCAHGEPPLAIVNYGQLKVGEWVGEDAFTNYDQLRDLIDKYNARIASVAPSLRIDPCVVDLRDALAHGRVSAHAPSEPMSLLKFGKPRKKPGDPNRNEVQVTFVATMNTMWFKKQTARTLDEVKKVVTAGKKLGMDTFKGS